ncbi:MAG: hypothetical protein E6614_30565, partial [Bradyrhizobium sp.]|nr:hypothetical protein [Bradyrhizobium sp.]
MKHSLVLVGLRAGVFALLGLIVAPDSARAGCSIGGTVQTCTGDVAAGVAVDPSAATLLVNPLTTSITPTSGTAGVSAGQFTSDISSTIDLGPFQIITSG